MKHPPARLKELVDVILERFQEQPETRPTEKGIRMWLARQGCNKREIDTAIKMVRNRVSLDRAPRGMSATSPEGFAVPRSQGPTTVRLLSVGEECKMSADARNALARLEVYGLLEPGEREMVLDYLNHYEGEVGMAELEDLLSWVVCSNRDVEFQQTLYNLLERRGEALH